MSCSKVEKVRRNSNFNSDEISVLIQIWGSVDIQKKFQKGHTRHSLIYEEISAIMKTMGYHRPADALQTKIANLKSRYYQEKTSCNKSGSSPSSWIHWQDMHHVLGSRPLANDGCITDSLRLSPELTEDNADVLEDDLSLWTEEDSCVDGKEGNDDNPNVKLTLSSSRASSSSTSPLGSPDTTPAIIKPLIVRKTKRSATENSTWHQLVENDKRLLQMSEKRMKLDEKLYEKQESMLVAATRFFNAFATVAEQNSEAALGNNVFGLSARASSSSSSAVANATHASNLLSVPQWENTSGRTSLANIPQNSRPTNHVGIQSAPSSSAGLSSNRVPVPSNNPQIRTITLQTVQPGSRAATQLNKPMIVKSFKPQVIFKKLTKDGSA